MDTNIVLTPCFKILVRFAPYGALTNPYDFIGHRQVLQDVAEQVAQRLEEPDDSRLRVMKALKTR
jgi:predicted secreted protein